MQIKYIREVDTGELIPIPQNGETLSKEKMPAFVKEDAFPEIIIPDNAYSANEIIAELTKQLEEERKRNNCNTTVVDATEPATKSLKVKSRKERMEEIYDKYNKPVTTRKNRMESVTLLCVVIIAILVAAVMLGAILPSGTFDTADINYNAYSVEQAVDTDENTVALQERVSDNTSTEHKSKEMSETTRDISSVLPLVDEMGGILLRFVLVSLLSATVIRVTRYIMQVFRGW